VGALGKQLGLSQGLSQGELAALMSGSHPSAPITLRSRGTIGGFDHVFAAPKSVSLLAELGDDDWRELIEAAHDRAVDRAFSAMEVFGAGIRRSDHGDRYPLPSVGLLGASFGHRLSRSGDPHLHTHVLLLNLGQDSMGRWSALDSRGLYQQARAVGAIYQAGLRWELVDRLGLDFHTPQGGLADIRGVDRSTIDWFSSRSRAIREEIEQSGRPSTQGVRRVAFYRTRPDKHGFDLDERRQTWREELLALKPEPAPALWPPERALGGLQRVFPPVVATTDAERRELVQMAGFELLTQLSVTSRRFGVLEMASMWAQFLSDGIQAPDLMELARLTLGSEDWVQGIGQRPGQRKLYQLAVPDSLCMGLDLASQRLAAWEYELQSSGWIPVDGWIEERGHSELAEPQSVDLIPSGPIGERDEVDLPGASEPVGMGDEPVGMGNAPVGTAGEREILPGDGQDGARVGQFALEPDQAREGILPSWSDPDVGSAPARMEFDSGQELGGGVSASAPGIPPDGHSGSRWNQEGSAVGSYTYPGTSGMARDPIRSEDQVELWSVSIEVRYDGSLAEPAEWSPSRGSSQDAGTGEPGMAGVASDMANGPERPDPAYPAEWGAIDLDSTSSGIWRTDSRGPEVGAGDRSEASGQTLPEHQSGQFLRLPTEGSRELDGAAEVRTGFHEAYGPRSGPTPDGPAQWTASEWRRSEWLQPEDVSFRLESEAGALGQYPLPLDERLSRPWPSPSEGGTFGFGRPGPVVEGSGATASAHPELRFQGGEPGFEPQTMSMGFDRQEWWFSEDLGSRRWPPEPTSLTRELLGGPELGSDQGPGAMASEPPSWSAGLAIERELGPDPGGPAELMP
jgi:conjugative relaxase-like TrwC/TraI family protein